tara:strand:+ start:105 stop:752 length:648 start_codon:yes stop_codon:yes gene_type:complete
MAYFDLRTFINENNLGAYAKLEGQKRDVDGDGDIDSDDYMAAKNQAIKKATTNEALGVEMAEMLTTFLALVGAGKTALEAVKILGDEHGDISISSIKDAIKQYKASKDMSEDLSADQEDKFHTKLDNLVHKTFGTSSDEKDMKEEVKGDFKIGDKVTYLGHPGEVTNVERQMTGATTYSVAYDKGQGRTKVTGIYNKGGEIKPMKENSLNLSDAL